MLSIRATLPLTMLLLSGCVVGPDHKTPEIQLPGKFAEAGKTSNGDISTVAWWNAFNDSRLNGYVSTGLAQNLTVMQAIERINQAEAQVISAGAGSLPSLTAQGQHTTSQTKGSYRDVPVTNASSGSLSVSWLLDLFGRYQRSKESANASLDAAYSTVDVQRLTLISAVTAAYIDVRYYQERLAIARQNLSSRRETLDLTKLQLEAGAASRLDVVQSEGLVNSTLSQIPGLETSFRKAAHRIATLLGMPASSLITELQKGARQPVARAIPPSGIPADLIRNRPDIRVAERNLAAAVAKIGVAEAQLYPSIELGGAITPSYNFVSGGGRGSANGWSFGPSIVLPILDGGSIRANIDLANSQAREQYLVWKSTVLNAVEEVENALAAVNRDQRTVAALRKTVASYQEALQLSTASYRDGASSLLDVLDAQRSVSDAQANLATAIQQTAQDYVSLNVALGGGYAVGQTAAPKKGGPTIAAAAAAKGM
ncbi:MULTISPECIES: efflux transporter outer membrane subunit [Agrobacterium tumefaciens complex]|uniref:efflux transporter outer membrane subunit n=1 Tax=Agrobacterium tumefaciens complex TaxID=1183400 RepID=UPI000DD9ED97|nr:MULTISPECIES: efflux transporter outer membrane subunit [Agrobacterium tumefaciens complex]MBB4408485.1 multidrug efflux system outer membrane protein [Agrobacterium radiobacter]MBB4453524.1 multidrug efflux system outer membrane protein [Agrobacterium radiobacter]MDR6590833.1 multidrug efflux system outer membrane protein [Agrobacterium tumefaciens]UNZ49930.1 efflux transporter outer membrane subunit [Agrobacterium tumefaciens]UXS25011.1 efflux transporter outer membrane subunit [Agrobacte